MGIAAFARSTAASAWLAGAAFAADPAQPSRAMCTQGLLEEFGWQFVHATGDDLVIEPGQPCDRADLAEARREGDLLVRAPQAVSGDPKRWQAELAGLLANPATQCAFHYRYGAATRSAADKLAANAHFDFSALQTGWIGFGFRGARSQGWEPIFSFGRGFQPVDSNARAIDTFYSGHVRAECGVGRQVAQYATLAELFGPAAFDRAFARDEIVIGTFVKLHRTPSILLGSHAGEFFADGLAVKTSAMGRQAFVGAPGILFHALARTTVDDPNNQAQNFVVYDVDPAAGQALRTHRGFRHYNATNRRIWELSRQVERRGRRWFERLVFERDPSARRHLPSAEAAVVADMDALLADPFYRGFIVYVHPKGVRPIGFHVARMLDRNPRTPFRIELTLHNVRTTLYQRYVEDRIASCLGTAVGAASAATVAGGDREPGRG
jgi:hypothetical protein